MDVLPAVTALYCFLSPGQCAAIVTEAHLSTFTVFQHFWRVILLKTFENPNLIFRGSESFVEYCLKGSIGAAVVKASQLPEMLPWLHNTQGVRGMETRNWFQSKIVPNNRKLKNRRIFKKQQLKNVLVCSFLFDSLLINLLLIFTSVYIQ